MVGSTALSASRLVRYVHGHGRIGTEAMRNWQHRVTLVRKIGLSIGRRSADVRVEPHLASVVRGLVASRSVNCNAFRYSDVGLCDFAEWNHESVERSRYGLDPQIPRRDCRLQSDQRTDRFGQTRPMLFARGVGLRIDEV